MDAISSLFHNTPSAWWKVSLTTLPRYTNALSKTQFQPERRVVGSYEMCNHWKWDIFLTDGLGGTALSGETTILSLSLSLSRSPAPSELSLRIWKRSDSEFPFGTYLHPCQMPWELDVPANHPQTQRSSTFKWDKGPKFRTQVASEPGPPQWKSKGSNLDASATPWMLKMDNDQIRTHSCTCSKRVVEGKLCGLTCLSLNMSKSITLNDFIEGPVLFLKSFEIHTIVTWMVKPRVAFPYKCTYNYTHNQSKSCNIITFCSAQFQILTASYSIYSQKSTHWTSVHETSATELAIVMITSKSMCGVSSASSSCGLKGTVKLPTYTWQAVVSTWITTSKATSVSFYV